MVMFRQIVRGSSDLLIQAAKGLDSIPFGIPDVVSTIHRALQRLGQALAHSAYHPPTHRHLPTRTTQQPTTTAPQAVLPPLVYLVSAFLLASAFVYGCMLFSHGEKRHDKIRAFEPLKQTVQVSRLLSRLPSRLLLLVTETMETQRLMQEIRAQHLSPFPTDRVTFHQLQCLVLQRQALLERHTRKALKAHSLMSHLRREYPAFFKGSLRDIVMHVASLRSRVRAMEKRTRIVRRNRGLRAAIIGGEDRVSRAQAVQHTLEPEDYQPLLYQCRSALEQIVGKVHGNKVIQIVEMLHGLADLSRSPKGPEDIDRSLKCIEGLTGCFQSLLDDIERPFGKMNASTIGPNADQDGYYAFQAAKTAGTKRALSDEDQVVKKFAQVLHKSREDKLQGIGDDIDAEITAEDAARNEDPDIQRAIAASLEPVLKNISGQSSRETVGTSPVTMQQASVDSNVLALDQEDVDMARAIALSLEDF